MSSTDIARTSQDLVWLLSGLIDRVPGTTSALLLSSDGLRKAAHGLDDDGADFTCRLTREQHQYSRPAESRELAAAEHL